jgi:hypothetical protein
MALSRSLAAWAVSKTLLPDMSATDCQLTRNYQEYDAELAVPNVRTLALTHAAAQIITSCSAFKPQLLQLNRVNFALAAMPEANACMSCASFEADSGTKIENYYFVLHHASTNSTMFSPATGPLISSSGGELRPGDSAAATGAGSAW